MLSSTHLGSSSTLQASEQWPHLRSSLTIMYLLKSLFRLLLRFLRCLLQPTYAVATTLRRLHRQRPLLWNLRHLRRRGHHACTLLLRQDRAHACRDPLVLSHETENRCCQIWRETSCVTLIGKKLRQYVHNMDSLRHKKSRLPQSRQDLLKLLGQKAPRTLQLTPCGYPLPLPHIHL